MFRSLVVWGCLMVTVAFGGDKNDWSGEQADTLLDKTLRLHLNPDLSGLSKAEQQTVDRLLAVGEIMHRLYLDSLHQDHLKARADLQKRVKAGAPDAQKLMDLFYLFKGGYATTLTNERAAFLPLGPEFPGRNFYPAGTSAKVLDAWLKEHPEARAEIMAVRTVVRRAGKAQVEADLATLAAHPYLEAFHPGLKARLQAQMDKQGFYAVPYSLAWADDLSKASRLLYEAADLIKGEDEDFAAYLRARSRDLLCDDYEGGDAAWVSGRFGRLNAQIGAYETYDDHLYGVKGAFSLSLVVRDEARSRALKAVIGGLQELENSLPYEHHKKVRADLPVGVYQVVADFGQARGTNTATILPNEAHLARKYGRTILLRHNILANPELYKITQAVWAKAVVDPHIADLTLEANFNRTLWHEIGHYLGPAKDKQGRGLSEALGKYSDLMEELKADLVSLYAVGFLQERGFYTAEQARAVRAAGIYRTLQKVKPRISQPYQSMQLMQFNFFLSSPVLTFRPGNGQRLEINYEAYQESVTKMLRQVLKLQYEGDQEQVAKFVLGLSMWNAWLHEDMAKNLAAASPYRYRLVTYGALKP